MSVVYSKSSLGQLVKLVLDNHQTEYHSLFLSVNTELKSALLVESLSGMASAFFRSFRQVFVEQDKKFSVKSHFTDFEFFFCFFGWYVLICP